MAAEQLTLNEQLLHILEQYEEALLQGKAMKELYTFQEQIKALEQKISENKLNL